ncbi:unnamed protein product [Prorocentrum cordatum]|uniref:EML-like second beta-propeller domain-containing protein n=1 Tax=Prorocentrum cordatum TaxID=2364126 RepID=A0ABN9Y8N1_9DINO|nr:unnamed protein product [Polarella glacialis]
MLFPLRPPRLPRKRREERRGRSFDLRATRRSHTRCRMSMQRRATAYIQVQDGHGATRARFGRVPVLVHRPSAYAGASAADNSAVPNADLRLSWAHGYDGGRVGSVHWISDNEFAHPLAGCCVVQRLEPRAQRFFLGHSTQVTCLAFSPAAGLCASGQTDPAGSGRPFVGVWAPSDCVLQTVLVFHDREIMALAFDPSGQVLFSMGGDNNHTIAAWKDFLPPQRGRSRAAMQESYPMVMREPVFSVGGGQTPSFAFAMPAAGPPRARGGGAESTLSVMFAAYDAGCADKGLGSRMQLQFWSFSHGSDGAYDLKGKLATFGQCPKPEQVTFVSWTAAGLALVCGDNGLFYLFEKSQPIRHGRVCGAALGFGVEVPGLDCLVFGSGDAVLHFGHREPPTQAALDRGGGGWLTPVRLADAGGALVAATARLQLNSVAVRHCAQSGRHLALVGTADHHLLLVDLGARRLLTVLQVAHGGETWALCHHPDAELGLFLTGGADSQVRFWDLLGPAPVVGRVLDFAAASAAPGRPASRASGPPRPAARAAGAWWPPDTVALALRSSTPVTGIYAMAFRDAGDMLALGHGEGTIRVLSFPELRVVFEHCASRARERVSDMKFSPGGGVLAAGSWDQQVYLYRIELDATSTLSVHAHRTLTGIPASVTHLQFSGSGEVLMVNSSDAQILYFDGHTGERCTAPAKFKDTAWGTPWTCVCGWPVMGMWAANKDLDITDINACCSLDFVPRGRRALLAFGDDLMRLQLSHFPAFSEDQGCRRYNGHGSHVTSVRVAPPGAGGDSSVLVTAGGRDCALLQWQVVHLRPSEKPRLRMSSRGTNASVSMPSRPAGRNPTDVRSHGHAARGLRAVPLRIHGVAAGEFGLWCRGYGDVPTRNEPWEDPQPWKMRNGDPDAPPQRRMWVKEPSRRSSAAAVAGRPPRGRCRRGRATRQPRP